MSAQAAPNTLCFIESVIVARRHFLLGHQQASASQMKAVVPGPAEPFTYLYDLLIYTPGNFIQINLPLPRSWEVQKFAAFSTLRAAGRPDGLSAEVGQGQASRSC